MTKGKAIRDGDNVHQSTSSMSASIFDHASRKLGRPLRAIEKIQVIAKYSMMLSLVTLTPFLLFDYWKVVQLHPSPKERSFENSMFDVGRAPRGSETRIVIYQNGEHAFSSTCMGIEVQICDKEAFWKKTPAKRILVTEMSPGKGIIKNIEIVEGKSTIEISNLNIESYITQYPRSLYEKNWLLLMILAISIGIFLTSTVVLKIAGREK